MTHRLDDLLKAAHERDLAEAPRQHRHRTPQCPPEHVLLLRQRDEWESAVREHVGAGCRYCTMLLDLKEKAAAEPVLPDPGPLVLPIRLRNPVALAADRLPDEQAAPAPEGQYEVIVSETRTTVGLRVRSRLPDWRHRLVRYRLQPPGDGEPVVGYLVLQEDVNDWLVGRAQFPAEELYQRLQGSATATVEPLEAEWFEPEQWLALRDWLRAQPPEAHALPAWQAWAEDVRPLLTDDPETATLFGEIDALLRPAP
jgi:hypothetical protein